MKQLRFLCIIFVLLFATLLCACRGDETTTPKTTTSCDVTTSDTPDSGNPFAAIETPEFLNFYHPELSKRQSLYNKDLITRLLTMLKTCSFKEVNITLKDTLTIDYLAPFYGYNPDFGFYYFDSERQYVLFASSTNLNRPTTILRLYQISGFDNALFEEALTVAKGFPKNYEEQIAQNPKP